MTESTALSPMQTFQENLKSKLRDDIASMLPEAAIQEMITKVVQEEFFAKRKIPDPNDRSYNPKMIEQGTKFQDMVFDAAKPILERLAKEWVADNQQVMIDYWKKATDTGIMQYVEGLNRDLATNALRAQLRGWTEELNRERDQRALPRLAPIW